MIGYINSNSYMVFQPPWTQCESGSSSLRNLCARFALRWKLSLSLIGRLGRGRLITILGHLGQLDHPFVGDRLKIGWGFLIICIVYDNTYFLFLITHRVIRMSCHFIFWPNYPLSTFWFFCRVPVLYLLSHFARIPNSFVTTHNLLGPIILNNAISSTNKYFVIKIALIYFIHSITRCNRAGCALCYGCYVTHAHKDYNELPQWTQYLPGVVQPLFRCVTVIRWLGSKTAQCQFLLTNLYYLFLSYLLVPNS